MAYSPNGIDSTYLLKMLIILITGPCAQCVKGKKPDYKIQCLCLLNIYTQRKQNWNYIHRHVNGGNLWVKKFNIFSTLFCNFYFLRNEQHVLPV